VRRFAFSAVDAAGAWSTGVLVASDDRAVDRALALRGLVLVRARPLRGSSRVHGRVISDFFYHLGVLVGAGVPIAQGLHDLHEDASHPLAVAIAEIARRVETGATLSEAFAQQPQFFSPLMVSIVRAGEETGKLDVVLRDLVSYLEWREELSRQVRSAMVYPTIVAVGLVGLCALLVLFVLPRFVGIFLELRVELPLPLQLLLWIQAAVVSNWPWLIGAGACAAALLVAWQRCEHGRRARDRAALALPLVRTLVVSLDMSRLCHNLGLLYASGLPILEALGLSAAIVQNRSIREVVAGARDKVSRGATLVDALRAPGIVPPMVLRMLAVGEATGDIDGALERAARFYEREVPAVIDRSIAWFNSAVIVALGATLLTIILSFFAPLYEALGNLNAG